jgi:hypothetical protein
VEYLGVGEKIQKKTVHADIRRWAQKINQRESARKRSALICEKKNR